GVTVEKDPQAALNWFWIGAGRGDERSIKKLTDAGLWAVAKKALLPGEPRAAGVELGTVSNQPSKPTHGRIPPTLLPEPWTTITDPKKLTLEEATAARERILHTRERPHAFTDYAYLMLAKLYTQAKTADPKLTQRAWILAIHDRAIAGDEEAGYLWGAARLSRFAVGLGPNHELEHYIRAMMKKGKPEAERDYAILCLVGTGGEVDLDQAYTLAEKAADGGLPSAISLLGEWYWDGKGTDVDKVEAGKFWKRAADAGDPVAQYYYGTNTASGEGLPKDEAVGVAYLRKASEAGYDLAMLDYGIALELGLYGQAKDAAMGTMYIDRAALAGNVTAQNFMGKKYAAGRGVAQDDAWACVYWRAAAQNGNADAQFSLGSALLNGEGVAKDKTEAVKWLTQASAHDNTDATDLLDQIAKDESK
ncbi:MAG: tetratricopeptide repeat protein, partial [Lacunisphaera sp.]